MNIPNFAQAPVANFQATGTLTGPTQKVELSREDAQQSLDSLKDGFSRWQSLDETDADGLKGQPGAVRLAGDLEGEYTEARFEGNTNGGQLTVFNNEPMMHYGAQWVTVTQFGPMSVDSFSIGGNEEWQVGPNLTHIDHQLQSSGGPIAIGGGPVTVTLTDQANGGYVLYPDHG